MFLLDHLIPTLLGLDGAGGRRYRAELAVGGRVKIEWWNHIGFGPGLPTLTHAEHTNARPPRTAEIRDQRPQVMDTSNAARQHSFGRELVAR